LNKIDDEHNSAELKASTLSRSTAVHDGDPKVSIQNNEDTTKNNHDNKQEKTNNRHPNNNDKTYHAPVEATADEMSIEETIFCMDYSHGFANPSEAYDQLPEVMKKHHTVYVMADVEKLQKLIKDAPTTFHLPDNITFPSRSNNGRTSSRQLLLSQQRRIPSINTKSSASPWPEPIRKTFYPPKHSTQDVLSSLRWLAH
jgi:hypothetical protein